MEQLALDTGFVTHGIPHVSFWNGRVLTAEDLRDEQLANQSGRTQLGRVIGSGVVSGFEVYQGKPETHVEVRPGLAIDGEGQVVELPVDVDLALVVPPDLASGDGWFTACDPVTSNSPTGTGLYLLVVRPTSQPKSTTAGIAAFGSGVATECGPKYAVEGVSFRLIGLNAADLAADAGHDSPDIDRVTGLGTSNEHALARNVLAHVFLDTLAWVDRFADPFGAPPEEVEFGTLTRLRKSLLHCEVPIAILTWTSGGVGLVDTWAVRRPPLGEPAFTAIQGLGSTRREHLGRAAFAQFQDHLAALLSEAGFDRSNFRVSDRFRYLPAAGLIPVEPGRPGFSGDVFGNLTVHGPVQIEPARIGSLLDESFHHPAIDLDRGEALYVYAVLDAVGNLSYYVFTATRIDFLGDELAIESVLPTGKLLRGQEIEIRGRGFGITNGSCRVEFAAANANPLAGSSDVKLSVKIPENLDVEPEGTTVTLEVRSDFGRDAVPVVVGRPEQEPQGQLHVNFVSATPQQLTVGSEALLTYSVHSTISPAVDVEFAPVGDADVVDQCELTPASLHMATEAEATVVAAITQIPDVETFQFGLKAEAGQITGTVLQAFSTEDRTLPPDPAINILTPDFDGQPLGQAEFDGVTVRLKDKAAANLEFFLEVTEAGAYQVQLEPVSLTVPWIRRVTSPSTGQFVFEQHEFTGGVARKLIRVRVGRDSQVIPQATSFTLTVNRPGRTDGVQRTYHLEGF
jgi:hypothetical protein